MHLSASWDLYWPSPVIALRMCPGIWSSLWEKKRASLPTYRVWTVATLAVILTALLSSALLDLQTFVHSGTASAEEGVNGSLSLPSPVPKGPGCFPEGVPGPGPCAGGGCRVTVPAGQELPRIGVSEPTVSEQRALRGSAPGQLALLNLHLDILLFEQKETFTVLKCSTPETSVFCTSWIK